MEKGGVFMASQARLEIQAGNPGETTVRSPRHALAETIRERLAQYHEGEHDGNGSSQRVAIYNLLREYNPERYAKVENLIRRGGLQAGGDQELIDLVVARVLNPVRIRRGPNGALNQ